MYDSFIDLDYESDKENEALKKQETISMIESIHLKAVCLSLKTKQTAFSSFSLCFISVHIIYQNSDFKESKKKKSVPTHFEYT